MYKLPPTSQLDMICHKDVFPTWNHALCENSQFTVIKSLFDYNWKCIPIF